jgi:uncharacterized protein with GYD domain
MIHIVLSKFRKKPSKEMKEATDKLVSTLQKQGVKLLGSYWTLGRYDTVFIFEGPDEGAIQRATKSAMIMSKFVATETLVALKREDALKLLD